MEFFTRQAERVVWYAGSLCSCGNTPESPANMACAVCGGLGYFYPGPAVPTLAALSKITQIEDLQTWGLTQTGDLICDQPPGAVPIAPWDLILTTWSEGVPFQGTVVKRGGGTTDTLPYRAAAVVSCVQTNATTGAVTTYTLNTDFSVSGKIVTWLSTTNAPAAGSLYALRYNPTYEWVAMPPGIVRMERGTNLGARTILRKREIVLRNAPGNLLPG